MRALIAAGALALLAAPASADPLPDWAPGVSTGPGGHTVHLTAEVTTITNGGGGIIVEGTAPVSFDLLDVTSLFIKMDFASPCEFEVGCVISAPTEVTVSGFAGRVSWEDDGGYLFMNGQHFPDQFGELDFAGPLEFTTPPGVFTDSGENVTLTPAPEPPSWSVLGVALLGLAIRPRRSSEPLPRAR